MGKEKLSLRRWKSALSNTQFTISPRTSPASVVPDDASLTLAAESWCVLITPLDFSSLTSTQETKNRKEHNPSSRSLDVSAQEMTCDCLENEGCTFCWFEIKSYVLTFGLKQIWSSYLESLGRLTHLDSNLGTFAQLLHFSFAFQTDQVNHIMSVSPASMLIKIFNKNNHGYCLSSTGFQAPHGNTSHAVTSVILTRTFKGWTYKFWGTVFKTESFSRIYCGSILKFKSIYFLIRI